MAESRGLACRGRDACGGGQHRATDNGQCDGRPEILGISSGASLAVILLICAAPFAGPASRLIAGAGGALVTLVAMLALARRSSFSAERMVLAGVAIGSALTALEPRI